MSAREWSRGPLLRRALVGCAALSWALLALGCDDREPRVWTPPPKPSPRLDAGLTGDMGEGGGGGGGGGGGAEAGMTGAGHMAGDMGGVAGGESESPWLSPQEAPRPEQVVMSASSERLWALWRHGDSLRLTSLSSAELAELSPSGLTLNERERSSELSAPLSLLEGLIEAEALAGLSLDELSLQSVYAERPWLTLSHPLLPSALLIDLSQPEAPPISLGLRGPFTFATHRDKLWLIGVNSEQPEQVAWRWLSSGELGELHRDQRGLSRVVSAAYALGQWVLSTEEGQCLTASRRSPAQAGRAWRCQSVALGRLYGDSAQLTQLGPLPRDDIRGRGLWAWSGTPGAVSEPLSAKPDEGISRLSSAEGLSWHGTGSLWSTEGDQRVAWSIQPWLISSMPAEASTEAGTEASTEASTEAGGANAERRGASEQIERALLSAALPSDGPLLALSASAERAFMMSWDEGIGAPVLLPSETWTLSAALELDEPDPSCQVELERCDELDHDCDGATHNGLCCLEGEVNAALLEGVVSADRDWLSAESELGLLVAVASGGDARLFTAPYTGGAAQLRARWPGVSKIEAIGNLYSLVALAARDSEGEPILLWNLNTGEGSYAQLPVPCDPLALSVIDQSFTTRVICADRVLEVTPSLAQITTLEPPEAGELLWAQRWHPEGLLADEVYYVVAIGETAQLSLWREGREEGLSVAREDGLGLPNILGLMEPSERLLALTPPTVAGGWPARVNAGSLQVWSPLAGWVTALGSRWPLTASVSAFAPLGVSVGYTEDPASVGDSFLQRLTIYTHHLGPNADFWGSPYKESIAKDSFAGAHPAGYPDLGGARPNLMSLVGSGLELSYLGCQ